MGTVCSAFVSKLVLLSTLVLASGCAMSPTQKKWAGFAAGAVVIGMIAAHDNSDAELSAVKNKNPIVPCVGDPRFCK